MDAKNYFDAEAYYQRVCKSNKLAVDNGFKFCTCSGIESLQGPLDEFKTCKAFFCVDDTNDGQFYQSPGGGFYKRRTFTVFIMHRYKFRDEAERIKVLDLCRRLATQVISHMLKDADDAANEHYCWRLERIMSRELGRYFLNGCTGLYFMVDMDEPVDLRFDKGEWLN